MRALGGIFALTSAPHERPCTGLAAEKWDMAATVANHLVKVEPENCGWWINLAYATRRYESIETAEAILLRARELHHDNAMIEFNLACYASVAGR